MIMRCLSHSLLALGCIMSYGGAAQAQNLVPNPGFEEHDPICDTWGVDYDILSVWFEANCGFYPQYFNSCENLSGPPEYDVPSNYWGNQNAFDGDGYAGALTFFWGAWNGNGSYLCAPLLEPLEPGVEYCFSLRANLGGKSMYRTLTLSTVFTEELPNACNGNATLNWPGMAQVVFDLSNVDTTNWALLEGSFIADGGEQYLTIGNFSSGATIDTVFMGYTNAPSVFAGYYIDAVELRTCDSSVGELEANALRVYPNPVLDAARFELDSPDASLLMYTMMDAVGRVVLMGSTTGRKLSMAGLKDGVYLLELQHGGRRWSARVVKQG